MIDAVEHIGLDSSIMYHVLEDNVLANLQFVVELPVAHEVTAKAAIAAKTVNPFTVVCRPSYLWHIGHLETVGHVTGDLTFRMAVRMPLSSTMSTT